MKFKTWEIALFAALTLTLLISTKLMSEQKELSDKIIRLHVVANSDSDGDQSLKLKVRDSVQAELKTLLADVNDRETARTLISANLDRLNSIALETIHENGQEYVVNASIKEENFPTRAYETFTLPAGVYESLRVEIGSAEGKNWWCVVFPPLCADSPVDAGTALSVLSDDEISLITEEGNGYAVKFRLLELLAELQSAVD